MSGTCSGLVAGNPHRQWCEDVAFSTPAFILTWFQSKSLINPKYFFKDSLAIPSVNNFCRLCFAKPHSQSKSPRHKCLVHSIADGLHKFGSWIKKMARSLHKFRSCFYKSPSRNVKSPSRKIKSASRKIKSPTCEDYFPTIMVLLFFVRTYTYFKLHGCIQQRPSNPFLARIYTYFISRKKPSPIHT